MAEQVDPQLIVCGLSADVTVPAPLPDFDTLRVYVAVNDAVTVRIVDIVTVQVPTPVHAPPQPAKRDPESAVAVSVTEVPEAYVAAQESPQLMPAGSEATKPLPVPDLLTASG
jgi:hypothetical protein